MSHRMYRFFHVCLLLLVGAWLAAAPALGKKNKKNQDPKKDQVGTEAPSWDVENPPGETYEVPLDVTEGTWINLDVSPDGKEIAFDLLGDLYVMPIEGGDATALSSGLAWDMQPRYSRDGRWLAFTSDRSGGDNIWIMDRKSGELHQVTEEGFRLTNDAAWSPDSDYLALRKHFTARRSLGAGEIWLYHRSGGKGLQLNERPNDEKDLGEPAFSPDGRYVYYSHDSTPGRIFQYNKDPNGQIYTVHRIDLETGESEEVLTGSGGAVCPTPSPDGRSLAFVRRIRGKSVLYVADLVSGKKRLLTDRLERDMQETWAIHGVYPNMAWTPDSRYLVFWAGGKIHRIDVESRAMHEIPFRVRQVHKMFEALRFPVNVAVRDFDVKTLRWIEVSPRGDRAVFQALGHLYVTDLAADATASKPRRLTRQHDHFELYPAFSRDGERIVYTTWNDDKLGSVRVISAYSGEGRAVTREPGHYVEPSFSPDGVTVVYRKVEGGGVLSPLYSREPGLYKVPTAGGEPTRLVKEGARPHFGRDSDRVYYLVNDAEKKKRKLVSVGLGSDLRLRKELVHAESEAATEFRVSPDGRWLAFTERFQAFLIPFPATGRPLSLSPKAMSIPIRQVSKDAGEHLHWSGDSGSLYWSLGPELFQRELKDAFDFLDGAPSELPEAPTRGVDLGFSQPTDRPEGQVALVGARIVTMRGDEVIDDGTVLVEGSHIVAVGPRAEIEVPAGAHRIDLAGKTIVPGFVDAHWHGSQGREEINPQRNWFNYASLAFGVTTVHDPSTDTSTFFAASELQKAGFITAPRLFSTGTILYGAASDFKAIVDSLDDARSHLRRLKAVGAISAKSYNQPRRDQRQQFIAAGRELEMMIVPEGGSLFYHNMTMVIDGHTGIEHNLPVPKIYDDVKQLWSKSRTGYTPTLVVSYGSPSGERYWYHHTDVWENERLLRFVPRASIDARSRRRVMAPEEEYGHVRSAEVCKELADLGVRVNVGAHGQREGLAVHWEMWMLEQGGMTPHEALRSATLTGAEHLGMDEHIGSIAVGKLADLAILDRNPLEDLRHSESVRYVMVNGRLYDAETMDQIGNHPEKRGEFFWEEDQAIELGW